MHFKFVNKLIKLKDSNKTSKLHKNYKFLKTAENIKTSIKSENALN